MADELHLDDIASPAQVYGLDDTELTRLAGEVRERIIDVVSHTGGHLAPSLGVVELTLALLATFNLDEDKLVWDVGHQAYAHKLLTGRARQFHTLRTLGGISGFPRPSESPYDHFGVGHSSTSISAALGMALARDLAGLRHHVLAVIGDGSLTAGEALEGLNLAGHMGRRLIVVLNDNEMSISPNVGALSLFLSRTLSRRWVRQTRREVLKFLRSIPRIGQKLAVYAQRGEWSFKSFFTPGMLFEALRFTYIGPVDGHDVLGLITTLKNMRDLKGPQFLHIMTKKGRGYEPAEKDPITFHAVPKFDPSSGCLPKSSGGLPSYSKIFGDWLCETAAKDNKLMAITPAMREGSGMVEFSRKFPDRYFDVAIAEQHAVTFAAGLAIGGYKPIVAIYSTFLQRAYDQVLHDVAIQKLPVLFAIDRAGIVGADGQTHQGAFDLSYLRCIPEMVIMTPSDENECRQMLYTGYHYNDGPSAVRYPRGNAVGVELTPLEKLPIGKGIVKRRGEKLAILNFGTLMPEAAKVAESLNATLVDMRFVKPLDEALILEMAASHEALVTVEENAIMGGAGSGVNEVLMAHRKPVPVLNIGLPDFFIPQGTQEEMRAELGLDATGMEAKIKAWLA